MLFEKLIFVINLLLMLLVFHSNNKSGARAGNICRRKYNCGDCMAASHLCAWCFDLNSTKFRCHLAENISQRCDQKFINDIPSSIQQQNASEDDDLINSNPILMKPQLVKLKLRPNESISFPLTFVMSKNYPIDIYFLFDASFTMVYYANVVATVIDELVKKITELTPSYQIGFGSFVDKETLPFMSNFREHKAVPCLLCKPGYGFINHLNLSNDLSLIKESLRNVSQSGNNDRPEGAFDAIVQAVVCKDIIGWREYSRKMVILISDEISHTAGDGKLGGIVEPNSLTCHLSKSGKYTWSTEEDYPSIAELAWVMEENHVNLIFAVTEKATGWYERLCASIPGSAVGLLDPKHVTSLVTDNFLKIQGSIQLSVNASEDIMVSLRSSCNRNSSTKESTSACFGIKVGEEVTFDVITSTRTCERKEFNIIPFGVEESLRVEIEAICSCDCKGDESNSRHCSGKGNLTCGLCHCMPGFYGDSCQCSGDDKIMDLELCRSPIDGEVCSGRGYCTCGQCKCVPLSGDDPSKIYYGKFCQCDDHNCIVVNNKICSGNGICNCGECKCFLGFSGPDCSCSTNTTNCISSNEQICNGKGTCECGSCTCNIDNRYKGTTCEDCPTCPGMCHQIAECASCHLNSEDSSSCSSSCGLKAITKVDEVSTSRLEPEENYCKVLGEDNCHMMFMFNYKENTMKIQRTKECIKVNYLLIIGSAVGGILVAGFVVLLVWKAVVTVYDKREYQAFEKEKKNANWNENVNPLYRRAVIKYDNPTFKPRLHKA